jgi:DNA polymerase III delta subunit
MQLKLDALPAHLARGPLKPVYTVSGDEPLLAIEAADAIRAAARSAGYSEREVVHADARSDWSQLLGAAAGLSLFAQKRVLDIRLPSGKPGKTGAEALATLAASTGEDLLVLVALPKLERKTREAAWPTALDRGASFTQAAREVWVRREKEAATQRAVQRLNVAKLSRLLARCAVADRAFKGLRPREADSDPWLELTDIALAVAT